MANAKGEVYNVSYEGPSSERNMNHISLWRPNFARNVRFLFLYISSTTTLETMYSF